MKNKPVSEEWITQATEDRLQTAIDGYRAKGQPVNSVGALRNKIRNEIEATRGTAAWVAIRERYNPTPRNTVAWCCVCDRPVKQHAISSWLEDGRGNIYCGSECQSNTSRHPISFQEWKQRLKDKGSLTTHRLKIVSGELVEGGEITIKYEDVAKFGSPLRESAGVVVAVDNSIDWESD